ncbi:MAG: glycosyltransferase family 4 protein [Deltaproteobacteria bacterium]|nr:glycosyltransferase family 4 protein [Deltaproteobacteria bacterium]
MEIHQLVHTLSYGDAVSGEVLTLKRCFQEMGARSEVYAINIHPRLQGQARDWRELKSDFSGKLILHFSLGSPLSQFYLESRRAKRIMVYHNLTGAEWFRGINPRIVADIESGRKELPKLCAASDQLIADSKFNASELKAIGFEAHILELPVDFARWEMKSNAGIEALVKSEGGLQVLHTGRLAPNKCIEDVIKTFYFLHHKIESHSRLWLVGIDIDTELYSFSLKRMVDELGLSDAVNFVGCLDDSELKALYQNCTVYMGMSEHEGFCVPLIEAMYFGLPVVAYASSAVPYTMDRAGVLVYEKRHPQMAELLFKIYHDQSFRTRLIQAGHERVSALSYDKFRARVGELFSNLDIS